MFDLSDRVAVISGGGGAIGGAIAAGLAQQGAKVALVGRSKEALEIVASEIREDSGTDIATFSADVSSEAAVATLAEAVAERFGRVDILVNSHGYNTKAAALDFPMEDWRRLYAVNVEGTMFMCKALGRAMIDQGGGKIVNVSSVRGVRANQGGNSAYASSKAAIDMLTRSLAAEWASSNVNVNAIAPALIATKLTEKQLMEPGRAERYLANIPWGRLGRPSDCVGAAVFLASDEADFLTGQIIYIDGGLTAIG